MSESMLPATDAVTTSDVLELGLLLLLVLLVFFGGAIPGYLIARWSGIPHPGLAFLPVCGMWVVLFQSIGRTGWTALYALVPYIGVLAISVWLAWKVPQHHRRSRWWLAALWLPLLNVLGYWVYALTLPEVPAPALEPRA